MLPLLVADLFANRVFLLVQGVVFGLGDMAAFLAGIVTLFRANAAIFGVQVARLGVAQVAFLDFVVDAPVLVRQAGIDFRPARMVAQV